MKNNIMKQALALIALGAMVCGCSSSDDNDNKNNNQANFTSLSERPDWYVDFTANTVAAPEWTEPSEDNYEHNMLVLLTLEQSLVRFSTDDDMMAAFVNGECREVCPRSVSENGDSIYFLMCIRGHGNEYSEEDDEEGVSEKIELRYYSGGAKEIFASKEPMFFVRGDYIRENFTPYLSVYGGKFTVKTNLDITLPDEQPFTKNTGDLIGFFVGNECRGVIDMSEPTDGSHYYTTLYGRAENEIVTVKYYSAEKKGVYTAKGTISTNNNDITNFNLIF